jgi:hypothetical protein
MSPQSESDMTDLRPRMVRVEHDLTDHHRRITDMEKWRQQTEISDARTDERFINMQKRLDKIDNSLSRLAWIFIGGFGTAIVAFIVAGGLKV